MKAVILAAGKGSRLKELTRDKPKPMVKVGKASCLEYIVSGMMEAGISDFIFVVGYQSEIIRDYFGDGTSLGISVEYMEQKVLDGTGNAIHITRSLVGDSPFLASYGDIVISPDNYRMMVDKFNEEPCDLITAVNWMDDPYKGAAVYLDEYDNIVNMIEKPEKGTSTTNWNNAGIYIFSPLIYEYTGKLKPSSRGEYELTQAVVDMLRDKRRIKGFRLEGYWGDIGTLEDLERISKHMLSQDANS